MHLSAIKQTGLVETLPTMHGGEKWCSPVTLILFFFSLRGVLGAAYRDDSAPHNLMDQLAEDMDELMRLMPSATGEEEETVEEVEAELPELEEALGLLEFQLLGPGSPDGGHRGCPGH